MDEVIREKLRNREILILQQQKRIEELERGENKMTQNTKDWLLIFGIIVVYWVVAYFVSR